MNLKFYLPIGLCLLLSFSCKKKQKPLSPDLAVQIDNLYNASAAKYNSEPDSAMDLGREVLRLGRSNNDFETVSKGYTNIAYAHFIKGNYPASLDTFQKALEIDIEHGLDTSKASHYNNIGNIFKSLENYDTAIQRYKISYELASKGYSNILKKRKYQLLQKPYSIVVCNSSMNLGYVYERKANEQKADKHKSDSLLDLARKYEDLALLLSRQIPYEKYLNIIYNNIGKIHRQRGNTDSAEYCFRKSIELSGPVNDIRGRGESYIFLAEMYDSLHRYDSAITNGRKALDEAERSRYPRGILMSCAVLAHAFDTIGAKDSALKYFKIKDTAFRTLYDVAKVQQVQLSVIDHRNWEEERKRLEEENARRRYTIIGTSTIAIIIAIGFGLLWLKIKKKVRNKTLERLGVASVLILFEYLNKLIEALAEYVFELDKVSWMLVVTTIVVFAIICCIAYFAFNPLHEWLEHWIKSKFSVDKQAHDKTEIIPAGSK